MIEWKQNICLPFISLLKIELNCNKENQVNFSTDAVLKRRCCVI